MNIVYEKEYRESGKGLQVNSLLGKRFGYLKVIGRAPNSVSSKGRQYVNWYCECVCGNIVIVKAETLRSKQRYSNIRSCGCKKHMMFDHIFRLDLVGSQIDDLTVIKELPSKSKERLFECQCKCGATIVRSRYTLTESRVNYKTCGCHNMSGLELIVNNFLKDNNLDFDFSVSYEGLVSDSGRLLSYDFKVVFDNRIVLIECQGQQHYESYEFYGGDLFLLKQIKHDNLKLDYAVKHDYPLIHIPYSLSQDEIIKRLTFLI